MTPAQKQALVDLIECEDSVQIGFQKTAPHGEVRIHHQTAKVLAEGQMGRPLATIEEQEDGTRVLVPNKERCQKVLEEVGN